MKNSGQVLQHLVLDHFYLEFTRPQILQLKRIGAGLVRCDYCEVTAGMDSWSGVYLMTNLGPYFEMLQNAHPLHLGIACSATKVQYLDPLKLKSERSDLSWRTGARLWKKTKKEWFRWASLRPRRGQSYKTEALYTWLMGYRMLHAPDREPVLRQASLDRFLSVSVTVGREHLECLRHHSQWLPGEMKFGSSSASFRIPTSDGGAVLFDMKIVPGNAPFRLVELRAQICPRVKVRAVRTKDFETKILKGQFGFKIDLN